jgi:hypothetical protein
MRRIVSVKLASGERRRVKLADCNKVLTLCDPDGHMFARVPKRDYRPGDDEYDWIDIGVSAEKLPELLLKPPAPRNRKPPVRNQGKTAECLKLIKKAFVEHWGDPWPTPTELARTCNCGRNPAYDAYERFYESREYREYIDQGCATWGPGRTPKAKIVPIPLRDISS